MTIRQISCFVLLVLCVFGILYARAYAQLNCDPTEPVEGQVCEPAHVDSKPIGVNDKCVSPIPTDPDNLVWVCYADVAVNSNCDATVYQVARKGRCVDAGPGYPYHSCIEDDSVATLEVVKEQRSCRFDPPDTTSNCACYYDQLPEEQQDKQTLQVCECKTVEP